LNDLEGLTDARHTELRLVQLVDDHAVGLGEAGHRPLDDVPGKAHAAGQVHADEQAALLGAVGPLPLAERHQVLLHRLHPGQRAHLVGPLLRKGDAVLEIADPARHHPNIGARMRDHV
jgi:hypothetical protein